MRAGRIEGRGLLVLVMIALVFFLNPADPQLTRQDNR
jgi:hypothetical protein